MQFLHLDGISFRFSEEHPSVHLPSGWMQESRVLRPSGFGRASLPVMTNASRDQRIGSIRGGRIVTKHDFPALHKSDRSPANCRGKTTLTSPFRGSRFAPSLI